MTAFADIEGQDVAGARREADFTVTSELLETAQTRHEVNQKMLRRDDTGEDIGVVHVNRGIIPYPQIMDWVTGAMDELQLRYKLRESVLMRNHDLYQEYVLDQNERGPDGEGFAPMILLRASHTGMPMKADMGTFRFVCANGIVIGQTFRSIKIGSRDAGSDLLQTSIKEDLSNNLENFSRVADLYRDLDSAPMNAYLNSILMDVDISAKLKKLTIAALAEEGNVEVLKEKIKSEDFQRPEELISIVNEVSAFHLYNILTNVATHKTRNASTRSFTYGKISQVFGV